MIAIEELLEAGVHFGHRVNKWNPKMAPYIFGERNGVHIIDLIQTLGYLEEVYTFLSKYQKGNSSSLGQKVLFVGTKKQVASIIKKEAINCNAHYVNHRWLGGLLTNWTTIKLCVNKLKTLEAMAQQSPDGLSLESGLMGQGSTKKERAILKKQYEKLKKFFGGIQNMDALPEIVIIVGQDCEMNAVLECKKLSQMGISPFMSQIKRSSRSNDTRGGNTLADKNLPRTITILDTNCDPSMADLFIPANDDSTKSVELILGKLSEAIRTA